jgi:tellurite resistance protein TehA-like permease
MAIERYVAAAGCGLFAMFAAEILVLYDFLQEPHSPIEATPKALQFISIGVAPASILAAISFIMVRARGSKAIGALIIGGGAAMMAGMFQAQSMLAGIDDQFLEPAIVAIPPLFAAISVPVMAVGALLVVRGRRDYGPDRRPRRAWSQSED